MIKKEELIASLIKIAQEVFEIGYGKKLSKRNKKNLTEYITLKYHNPGEKLRFKYCKDGNEFISQWFTDNEWLCLHNGDRPVKKGAKNVRYLKSIKSMAK